MQGAFRGISFYTDNCEKELGEMKMRVIVADDQVEVRSALKLIMEEKSGLTIIGEVAEAKDLLKLIRVDRPDLILLDWGLPGILAQDLIAVIRSLYPEIRIIVLDSLPQVKKLAISAGVDDFVCKSDPPELLLSALDKHLREKAGTGNKP
jgi:DNA-binding NarL/FixJ family response regulator